MVSRDARRECTGESPQEAQQVLNALTQELKNLQQDVVIQLAQDVARLQREKSRLVREIEALQDLQIPLPTPRTPEGKGEIDSPRSDTPPQWIQELAKSIADRLNPQLSPPSSEVPPTEGFSTAGIPPDTNEHYTQIEHHLNQSYCHLEKDLADRHSLLSQQLRRMENLQQQGEAILTALIDRMSQQLPSPNTGSWRPPETSTASFDRLQKPPQNTPTLSSPPDIPSALTASITSPEQSLSHPPTTRRSVRQGLILAFFSTILLALFNLSLKQIFQEHNPWSQSQWETWSGILEPSWGNILLLSFLRMAVVMLLLSGIAMRLYPLCWQEVRQWLVSHNRRLQRQVLGSGICLFCSQILVYKAIGQLPTAVAISLFFTFPALSILGSWLRFGERPTATRWAISTIVLLGGLFCLPERGITAAGSEGLAGDVTALLGGVVFAGYVLLAQQCGKQFHPIPLSFVNFWITLILSGVGVVFARWIPGGNLEVPSGQEWTLLVWGAILGGFSALSYLANTLAIAYGGATLSSIVGATVPILTALFGWLLFHEQLYNNQIFGVVLVTIGVISLNLEKLFPLKSNPRP